MSRKHLNLFAKFNLAFISIGLLPVLFISMFLYNAFQSETYEVMQNTYQQIAIYGAQSIDNMIEKYNNITKMLYSYNPESGLLSSTSDGTGLAKILKTVGRNDFEQVQRERNIMAFVHMISNSDGYIRSTVLVERDGVCYPHIRGFRFFSDTQVLECYRNEDAFQHKNKLFFLPTRSENTFLGQNNQVFTLGRNYIDLSTAIYSNNMLATLYIDVDTRAIDHLFSRLEVYQQAEILITDSAGNIIYANPKYYAACEVVSKTPDDLYTTTVNCIKPNWELSIIVDCQEATRGIANLMTVIYIVAAVVVVVLLLPSLFFSGMLSQPARRILRGMKQVEAGDFGTHIDVRNRDEMGRLAEGFNYMTKQLEQYNQVSLLSHIKWKEAELIALRAQINPHFLYNSLEIIRMNAVANNDESTGELAFLLAEQMRYSLRQDGETVALNRELEITKGYFKFIDIRYDHNISFEITVGKNLADVRVLGLVIQPVVENAVIHGLMPKGAGHVQVNIEQQQEDLAIRVMDNGAGMSEETIHEIVSRLDCDERSNTESISLGLKNVHDRVRLKFGEPYGVSISSQLKIGTLVTILLPLIQEDCDDA